MISTAATVTRTLALSEPADQAAIARLEQAEGIVAVQAHGRRLTVTYDVRAMVMGALEKVAGQAGLKPSSGLLARLGRAWAGFQDENLREQVRLQHRCCSDGGK